MSVHAERAFTSAIEARHAGVAEAFGTKRALLADSGT